MPTSKLIRNYLTLFAGNVAGQFFFFVAFAHLARLLGPSKFGVWNFAQVWMLYLLRIGEFGLEVVGVREASRNPHTTSAWIGTVVSSRLALAVCLFSIPVLLSLLGLLPAGTTLLVLVSSFAVFPMAILLEWVYEAKQEIGPVSGARVIKGLLFFVGVFFLVPSDDDGSIAAYLYVASLSLPAIIIFIVVVRRHGFGGSSVGVRQALRALGMSAPIGVSSLLLQYCLSVGPMTVAYLLSREDLGFFTSAHRIVLFLWAYVITSSHRILLPNLAQRFKASVSGYEEFVGRFFRLSAITATPAGLVGTVVATAFMVFLFSSEYEPAGIVFAIVLWAFVLAAIRSILEIALIASDQQRQYVKGMVFVAVVYTLVTPVLTVGFGIVGTAMAAVISEAFYCTYLILTFPGMKPSVFLKSIWKPITAGVLALGILYPLATVNSVLLGFLSLGIYVLVIIATKAITRDDYELIKSLFRRDYFATSA